MIKDYAISQKLPLLAGESCGAQREYLIKKALVQYADEPDSSLKRAKLIAYLLDHVSIVIGEQDRESYARFEESELTALNRKIREMGQTPGGDARSAGTGHRVIAYEKVLETGVCGILDDVRKRASRESDTARANFYKGCDLTLTALLRYAGRHGDKLRIFAAKEKDQDLKAYFLHMADLFDRVPAYPARSFHEAMQCLWFMQYALRFTEDNTLAGRPDDYLWPYYESDVRDGLITKTQALRLIEELYIKMNELYLTWPASLMVGGVNRKGEPVCNDLTRLFIKAIETTGLVNPSVAIAYRESIPDDLLDLCIEVIAKGYTKPAIFNDDLIIAGLLDAGVALEDARAYIHSTCVEITPIGSSNIAVASPYINLTKAFEYLFNNGQEIMASDNHFNPGFVFDIKAIHTFHDLLSRFKTIAAGMIKKAVDCDLKAAEDISAHGSNPLYSCFVRDCLEKGLDSGCGGARYNFFYPCFPGFTTVVDSLCAIREIVFEKKLLTLEQYARIIADNFAGHEPIRQYAAGRCSKFGNADDKADALAVDLYNFIRDELKQYKTCLNGTFHPSYFSWIMHGYLGKNAAATPDGRKCGQALSECIGPVQGMDRKGPTAIVNSAAKLDQKAGIGGIATNFRFSREFLQKEHGKAALKTLIQTYMRKGGFEMQFNVIDQDTLIAAKENPENYRHLMVRVAGYSDYFVDLDPVIQDEIISRTEHGAV